MCEDENQEMENFVRENCDLKNQKIYKYNIFKKKLRNSYLKSINYIKKKTYIDEWHIKMLYNEYKKKKKVKKFIILHITQLEIYTIFMCTYYWNQCHQIHILEK